MLKSNTGQINEMEKESVKSSTLILLVSAILPELFGVLVEIDFGVYSYIATAVIGGIAIYLKEKYNIDVKTKK